MDIIDKLLETPCYIMDFLPKQVPMNCGGQFFEVETYLLNHYDCCGLRDRFVGVILKAMCYYPVSVHWGKWIEQPTPEQVTKIIDTILNAAAGLLGGLPKALFINLMLIIQNIICFFVPSSSGHAALTIPIMAPLADLVGVSRQNIITAYQFGTGITSFITPTNGVLMACLTMAKIPWAKFIKFVLPLVIVLWLIGAAALTLGLQIFPA